jgi:hypothetical protein
MSKIGRNEKCPCGSGIKYKNCCLPGRNNQKNSFSIDIASYYHTKCLADGLITTSSSSIKFQDIYSRFCEINGCDKSMLEHINEYFVAQYINYVEEMIIELCSEFSSYEMYFWYRRIKPVNFFNEQHPETYHELMKNVIISYGSKKDIFSVECKNDIDIIIPNYLVGINIENITNFPMPKEIIPVLNALYKLEYLAFYYIYLSNCQRIEGKGGKYILDEEKGFKIVPKDEEIDYLINYYDERLYQVSLLTKIGTQSYDNQNTDSKYLLFVLSYNFDGNKNDYFKNIKFVHSDDRFNFELGKISIENYYYFMKQFNTALLQKHGFRIEEILSVILCFSRSCVHILASVDLEPENKEISRRAFTILQRGYFVLENSEDSMHQLIEAVKKTYKQIFPDEKKPVLKNLLAAFNFLVYTDRNFSNFQERLLTGFMLLKVTNRKYLVDYTSFVYVLQTIVDSLRSIDGDLANLVSKDLESKTKQTIISVFGKNAFFVNGELNTIDGKKKEIDASFIINECLIIFECKSLSVSEGTLIGSKNSLDFRKRKLTEYLSESESKAEFIINNKEKLTKKIPDNIKYIAPLVVTSFPEYIWEKSDMLFINDKLSRFFILNDIERLNNENTYRDLIRKPFIRKV